MLRQNSLNRYTAGFLDVNEQHLAAIGEEHSNYPFAIESEFRTRQHATIGEEHRNLVLMLPECFPTAFEQIHAVAPYYWKQCGIAKRHPNGLSRKRNGDGPGMRF